jgi:PAS domain S-box-containing protein
MFEGRGGRVLIVEDDAGVAKLQQRRLERAGYSVVCVGTAPEALGQIERGGVELMLLDNRLPDVTGLEFYEQLKAAGHNLPVILVTGFSDETTAIQALRAGVRDFVTKSSAYLDYLPEAAQRVLKQVRTENRLAAIVTSAMDAILTVDQDQRVVVFNPAAEKMFGLSAAEALGQPVGRFIPQDLPGLFQGTARPGSPTEDRTQGKCVLLEMQGLRGDGKAFPIEVSVSPLEVAAQQLYTVIVRDLSEKKKLETQYLRAQRMETIGRLAGGIAHDLNNVLGQFLLALECLKEDLSSQDRQTIVGDLQANARRGSDIVKQVLSFAKGIEGERALFQPRHVIRDVEKMLQHTLPRSITVEARLPSDLWAVNGDATQLYQVIMNLCVNALDAMPRGGRLTISAENALIDEKYAALHRGALPGPYVLIRVADTGTGIPPEMLDKIFDPFFTTKEPGKGTGLGLSTVMAIVKGHEGFINVYSEVGRGSEFVVYLPATENAQTRQAEEEYRNLPAGHGELILVVDDEAAFRQITKATLETFGYRVLTASNGAEALGELVRQPKEINAVIVDMMMPIMEGKDVIRALQQLDARVPIIAASGLVGNGHAATAAGTSVAAFLQKPYTAATLLCTLRQVLDASAPTS